MTARDIGDLIVKDAALKYPRRSFIVKQRARKRKRTWVMYGIFNFSTLHGVGNRKKDARSEARQLYGVGDDGLNELLKSGAINIRRIIISDWGYGKK